MDESRKAFEKWWEEWFGEAPLTQWDELWYGDGYSAEDIDHMWDAWKGSRSAIEIELPQIRYGYAGNKEFKPEEVVAAIRAAGIKVEIK